MKPLIKYILLCVSTVMLLPHKIATACGFYISPGEYRFWLLQPDIANERDLTPFYFASGYLYKNDLYAATQPHIEQNINEWYEITGRKALKKDIDSLLNATSPEVFFAHQKELGRENSFMNVLLEPKNKELFEYIQLSKKVEQVTATPDPWDEENFPKQKVNDVINELRKLRAASKAPFIKLRTAFQLIRLLRYNAQSEEAKKVYDAWIAPLKTESWVKTAALYQIALNQYGPQQDYLLSKVFDIGGYYRTMCLIRFDAKNIDETIKLAMDQHEKNVLLAMKIFNYQGRSLDMIKKIYSSEPQYKELPFLLLREINKVEDWLLTNKVTSFPTPAVYIAEDWYNYNYEYRDNAAANYRRDLAYSKELSDLIHTMIPTSSNKQKALLHLYAAHLDMLNKDYASSSNHLSEASRQKDLPENIKTQIAINRYLLHLENGFDKNTEDEFMKIVSTSDQKLGIYDPGIMKSQLILYTAKKLIKKGDKARGLLLLSKTDRAFDELPISNYKTVYQEIEEQANEEDYHIILNTFDKKNKTPFEQFVCAKEIRSPQNWYWDDTTSPQWSKSKLLDCLSSWYLRQHRLNDAYTVLKQIPPTFWQKYPYDYFIGGNPFYLNFYRAHPVTKEDKRSLNKKQVVEQMIYLEDLAKKDKSKTAECYYQLANAWYNMTYYGKNWLMVKTWWSINEPYSWPRRFQRSSFHDDYFGCMQAQRYYDMAIRATGDKKLAALCFFMSKNCSANYKYYMEVVNGKEDEAQYDYSPDYALAKKRGIDKEYYKSIVEECETYQSFIRQYNKTF